MFLFVCESSHYFLLLFPFSGEREGGGGVCIGNTVGVFVSLFKCRSVSMPLWRSSVFTRLIRHEESAISLGLRVRSIRGVPCDDPATLAQSRISKVKVEVGGGPSCKTLRCSPCLAISKSCSRVCFDPGSVAWRILTPIGCCVDHSSASTRRYSDFLFRMNMKRVFA